MHTSLGQQETKAREMARTDVMRKCEQARAGRGRMQKTLPIRSIQRLTFMSRINHSSEYYLGCG
jgi:hypothetical protein